MQVARAPYTYMQQGYYRTSPTYLFVNKMRASSFLGPSGTYPSGASYYGRYASHGWDLSVGTYTYPYTGATTTEVDEVNTRRLMEAWLAFILDVSASIACPNIYPFQSTHFNVGPTNHHTSTHHYIHTS